MYTLKLSASDFPVASVTVFKSQAEVIRTFDLELQTEQNKIEIDDLPSGIDSESVRISHLSNGARLFDVFCITASNNQDKLATQSRETIRLLEAQKKELLAQQRILQHESDLLVTWGKTLSADHVGYGDIRSAMSQFVEGGRRNVRDVAILEEKIVETEREIENVRKKNNERKGIVSSKVTVVIGTDGDDSVSFKLSYAVSDASWKPAYELHASSDSGNHASSISLHYCAQITQSTGEDWSDSSLTLSAVEVGEHHHNIPVLRPLRIKPALLKPWANNNSNASSHGLFGRAPNAPAPTLFGGGGGAFGTSAPAHTLFGAAPAGFSSTEPAAAPPGSTEEFVEVSAGVEEVPNEPLKPATLITETPLSISYSVAGQTTIPSDGLRHQVPIAVLPFDADVSHIVVPRIKPVVHLQCRVKNTSDYRLLPGNVTVLMDGSYVSRFRINEVSKGETFDCTLGVDPAIKVNYVRKTKASRTNEGTFAETLNIATYTNKLVITNTHPYSLASLIVKDCLPLVSGGQQAKVLLKKPVGLAEAKGEAVDLVSGQGDGKTVKVRWSKVVDGKGGENDGMFEWSAFEVSGGSKVEFEAEWEVRTPAETKWVESVDLSG